MHAQANLKSILASANVYFEYCSSMNNSKTLEGVLIQNRAQQEIIEHLYRDKLLSVGLACMSKTGKYDVFSDGLDMDAAKGDIAFLNQKMDGRMNFTYGAKSFLYNADRIAARDALFALPNDLIKDALIASNEFSDAQIAAIKDSNSPLDYLSNDYLCQAFSRYLCHTNHQLDQETIDSVVSFLNVCDGLFLPTIYKECGCYGFRDGRIWLISSCDNEFSAEIFASADRNNILEKWSIIAYI